MCWAGTGILTTATGESVLRLWDLANNNNYVLTLESQPQYDKNEVMNCVSYCKDRGGCDVSGSIFFWGVVHFFVCVIYFCSPEEIHSLT